ncbi:hypothetical protein J3459_007449 [Metarhizium acridum]|nr:hypothetical protein J3459_019265 [Metarhizium acridum]KAG8427172.1 hypothetical protein J3459_007449 [Metarhizium acridum]
MRHFRSIMKRQQPANPRSLLSRTRYLAQSSSRREKLDEAKSHILASERRRLGPRELLQVVVGEAASSLFKIFSFSTTQQKVCNVVMSQFEAGVHNSEKGGLPP